MRVVGQRVANIHVVERVDRELEVEGCVLGGILIGNGVGHRGGIVGVAHHDVERIGDGTAVAVTGNHLNAHRADIAIGWCAREGAGRRIEAQPRRQGAATGHLCTVGQRVTIHISENAGLKLEVEGGVFSGVLVGNGVGNRRGGIGNNGVGDFNVVERHPEIA